MGYGLSFQDAGDYERYLNDPQSRYNADLQNRLMVDMLEPIPGQKALGIGCGSGTHLLRLNQMKLQVTGLDPSPHILDIVRKNLGNRVDLQQGFAEDLPFEDNSFDYVCMISILEFVDDPRKAIEEACRVAKDTLFLVVMNRYGIKGIRLWVRGRVSDTVYSDARFLSLWGLIRTIRDLAGDVPLAWRTVSRFPGDSRQLVRRIKASGIARRWPFGDFVGISATLTPRFRTRPLTVAYSAKP